MAVAPQPVDPRLAKLLAGEPLELPPPPTDREETPEEKAARSIPAKWLEDLAPRPERKVQVPVWIARAIIEGPLDLKYATFEYEVAITGSKFGEKVDFSFATFKREAQFDDSQFPKSADFRGAHAKSDFSIAGASFGSGSRFQDLHVEEVLQATGASFGKVNFQRIKVGKSAFFRSDDKRKCVEFGGDAHFHSAHVQDNAEFDGAQFKGEATFQGMQVVGSAYFRTDKNGSRVQFGGKARFHRAHIRGQASFRGARFEQEANFDEMRVDGNALFRADQGGNAVRFGGATNFRAAIFNSAVTFAGAEFQENTDFNNAQFRGLARFSRARFAKEKTSSFIGARFDRGSYFVNAQFQGRVDFTASGAERDAYFEGATFSKDASFREASFRVVHFQTARRGAEEPSGATDFGAGVDLRGFTYERMGVDWRSLLGKLTPYDRQPYTQLEKTFREVGEDHKADEVYLERRRVEGREKWKRRQYGSWFGDALYRVLANYGVRPYRLLVFTALVLGFGMIVFTRTHAVTHKDLTLRWDDPPSLGWKQAAAVSVNLFLPVEVAAGGQWIPTENPIPLFGRLAIPFTAYASVHRLAGWLLVPLGVAALTGLLRRPAKT